MGTVQAQAATQTHLYQLPGKCLGDEGVPVDVRAGLLEDDIIVQVTRPVLMDVLTLPVLMKDMRAARVHSYVPHHRILQHTVTHHSIVKARVHSYVLHHRILQHTVQLGTHHSIVKARVHSYVLHHRILQHTVQLGTHHSIVKDLVHVVV